MPQPLGHDEPVQIGADGQAHGGPEGVADTGDVGQARNAQQQPGGHVAGLGAHGGDIGAQLSAAQIELSGGVAGLSAPESQIQHHGQIGHDGNDDTDGGIGHRFTLFLSKIPLLYQNIFKNAIQNKVRTVFNSVRTFSFIFNHFILDNISNNSVKFFSINPGDGPETGASFWPRSPAGSSHRRRCTSRRAAPARRGHRS